jgi:hypothetical protein
MGFAWLLGPRIEQKKLERHPTFELSFSVSNFGTRSLKIIYQICQPFNNIFLSQQIILKKLDYFRSCFFWQSGDHKKKYRLTKWNVVCTPKDQGGLGVLNLEVHNKCLLSKWLFKFFTGDEVWQQILRNKYLRDKTLTQVQYMPEDSQF